MPKFSTMEMVENFATEKSDSIPEQAYNYIVNQICTGQYPPGTKISDRRIARQLQVSHVPVREAISKLEERGWVERVAQKGAYVTDFTESEIEDRYLLREIMEAVTVRQCAEKATAEDLEQLENAVGKIEAACDRNDPDSYKQADLEFHLLLNRMAGNKRIHNFFNAILLQGHLSVMSLVAHAVQMCFIKHGQGFEHSKTENHRQIFDAIVAHDADRAEMLIRKHIKSGYEIIAGLKKVLL